jgi:K+-transporting ATPase ATPase C chain
MGHDFTSSLRPAFVMTLLFALLLGLAYPLLLTGIGQLAFPHQANGSLIRDGDRIVGSAILAQGFASDRYFHPRPSAAGKGYDATASSGSNLGPASQALHDRVAGDVKTLSTASPGRAVPADLVTTSASGLDPDISPEAAFYQVSRVAKARGLDETRVRQLVETTIDHPLLGFLGEDRVNVLALNRQLDQLGAKLGR